MNKLAPFYIVVAAVLWGIDGIVLTPTLYSLPVSLIVFMESCLIGLLLSPVLILHIGEIKKIRSRDWTAFIGVAVFGGVLGTMSITKALFYVNYVNLSIVILIQKLQPLFALILAYLFLKERLPKIFFMYAMVAIIGAYLMTFGLSLPNFSSQDKTTYAAIFAIIAAISFAASTVFSKRALMNVGFELGTYLRFALTTLIIMPIVVLTGDIHQISDITTQNLFVLILIAFTTGGAAIFLYYYGLKRISASVATICELAMPLTAIILEYLLHDYIMSPFQWLGSFVLFITIYKVTTLKLR